jgi:hypothetical protein
VNTTTGPWAGSVRQRIAPVTILSWSPAEPARASEIVFVQTSREAPFRAGDEVVILLRNAGAFMMQPLDGRAGFTVKDGAVHPRLEALAAFDGLKVADFVARLRALAK